VNIYRPLVVPFGFFANTSLTGVTDITRTQALLLFSGTVSNWDQFGPGYPTAGVVICLRHAGSGTHATLDAAVMRGDWNLVTEAKTGSFPKYYFNDTSGDMMNCINGQANSIGYADADQTNLASTKSLTYNGRAATAQNIQYGLYEFWSTQWIFEKKLSQDTNYNVTHPIVAKLMEYAAIEDNIPGTKEGWWTTSTEMKVEKANDFAYLSFK
jgi:ABC-type phosphate transport system substrate-binding protein